MLIKTVHTYQEGPAYEVSFWGDSLKILYYDQNATLPNLWYRIIGKLLMGLTVTKYVRAEGSDGQVQALPVGQAEALQESSQVGQ